MTGSIVQRVLPFLLTLAFGVLIGSIFSSGTQRNEQRGVFQLGSDSSYSGCLSSQRRRKRSQQLIFLSRPQPSYTEAARQNRVSGVVELRVVFGSNGKVLSVEPLTTLPYGLTEEAIKAAREIRFIPASERGQSFEETRILKYAFDLDDLN